MQKEQGINEDAVIATSYLTGNLLGRGEKFPKEDRVKMICTMAHGVGLPNWLRRSASLGTTTESTT